MDNKRKFSRFDINVPAVIEFMHPGDEKMKEDCMTVNLSAGGAFISTSQPLKKGTTVRIDFTLQFPELETPVNPSGDLKVTATGCVLRTGPVGTAIRFNENYEITLGKTVGGKRHPVIKEPGD